MKTSDFRSLLKGYNLDIFEHEESWQVMEIDATSEYGHKGDVIARIDWYRADEFSIYSSKGLTTELIDAIIEYARTPVDDREEQEIETTFFRGEIKFAKKFVDNLPNVEHEPAIGHFQLETFKFIIYGLADYEMLISIMKKASGKKMIQ